MNWAGNSSHPFIVRFCKVGGWVVWLYPSRPLPDAKVWFHQIGKGALIFQQNVRRKQQASLCVYSDSKLASLTFWKALLTSPLLCRTPFLSAEAWLPAKDNRCFSLIFMATSKITPWTFRSKFSSCWQKIAQLLIDLNEHRGATQQTKAGVNGIHLIEFCHVSLKCCHIFTCNDTNLAPAIKQSSRFKIFNSKLSFDMNVFNMFVEHKERKLKRCKPQLAELARRLNLRTFGTQNEAVVPRFDTQKESVLFLHWIVYGHKNCFTHQLTAISTIFNKQSQHFFFCFFIVVLFATGAPNKVARRGLAGGNWSHDRKMATTIRVFCFFALLSVFLPVCSARILYLYYDQVNKEVKLTSTIQKSLGEWVAMSVTEDMQNTTG